MQNEGEFQENDDSYQRPLSPVLSLSSRSAFLSKRKRMKSRVKLANRFSSRDKKSENASKENVSIVSNESFNLSQEAEFIESLKIFEKIEDEQCISSENVPPLFEEDSNSNFKKPSSPAPVARKIKQAQELEFKGFQTAAGKNIKISSSVSQSKALFDDILNPLKSQESRCNKYSFLTKIKPDRFIKDKTNVMNLTEDETKNRREISNKNFKKASDELDCDSKSNIPKQHNENLYTSFLNSGETDHLFSNITQIENQIIETHPSNVIVSEDIKANEEFKGFDENSIAESNRIAGTMIDHFRTTHKTYQTCSKRILQEVHDDRKRFKSDSVMTLKPRTSSSFQKLKLQQIETVSSSEGFKFASQEALEQAASKLLDSAENTATHNSKSSVFPNSSRNITQSSQNNVTDISKESDLSCTSLNEFRGLDKENKITASYGGFQLASRNPIYLSEEALKMASAKLLADEENLAVDKLQTLSSKNNTHCKRVRTPTVSLDKSNKRAGDTNEVLTPSKVLRSAENALEEVAAQLLESEENKTIDNSKLYTNLPSSSKCITSSFNDDIQKSETTAACMGFQLASGNSVYVSEEALKRASAKLLDTAADAELENKLKSSEEVDLNMEQSSTRSLDDGTNKAFTPNLASGNAVSLKTAKVLLKDKENVTLNDRSNSSNRITKSSIKTAKDIFKGIIDLDSELFNPSLNNFNKIRKARNHSEGFLFASRNAVQLPESALKSDVKVFDSEKNIVQENLSSDFTGCPKSTKQSSTHTTEKSSIKTAKDIFKGIIDLDSELFNPSLNNFNKIRKARNDSEGFLFASRNAVQLPESALKSDVKVFDSEKNIVQENLSSDFTGCPKSAKQSSMHATDNVKQNLNAFSGLSNNPINSGNEQPNYKDTKPSTSSRRSIDALESTSKDNANISQERGTLNTSRRKLNQRKRLGTTPNKPMYISSDKLEKCKLIFEDDKSLNHSPSKSSEPLIFNSTPSKHFSSIPSEPDITPIKNINHTTTLEQEQENCLDNSVIIQECTKGDVKEWTESFKSERFRLETKLKVIMMREEALNRQKYVLENSTPDYRRRRTGVLFNKKQIRKEFRLQNFVKVNSLQHHFSYITPQNAERVHFNYAEENVPFINTEDGASVIPNVKDLVGLSEIEMAFRTMPGIEPKLIPTGWISNHFKWIVWKLASYERYASNLQGALTLENVIQQLKYRYDREIDKAERSALRKILERDDVSQKRIVLCVSNIFNVANGKFELELTDGWYSIRTTIDQPLCAQVNLQRIKIGTKLIICGAELLNCDGCHPFEATDMIRLKICYNSTRRALWHAKLGYQRWAEPFPLPLSSLLPDGGIVGCVKVYIARIYPVKYLEKQNKLTVWRNKKAEEIRAQSWENERSNQIEVIRELVRKDCEQSENKKQLLVTNLSDIRNINCPETLYNLYQTSRDPESLHEILSQSQINSIMEHQRRSSFTLQQDINRRVEERVSKLQLPQRDVTPMQQILVIDTLDPRERSSVLQIWRPSEAHVQLLKESAVFYVYNVSPKKNGLCSTSRTKFQALSVEFQKFDKYKRILTPISVLKNSINRLMFNEFDTVGIVVQVSINNFEQSLWLADACGSLLFVKVFEGPKNCSLFDSTKSGQLVAVSNLVWTNSKFEFAEAIANHSTTLSFYPKQKHLQEGINKFNEQCPEDLKSFLVNCNQRIAHYIDKINLSRACNSRSSSFLQSNTLSSCEDFDETCEETTLTQSRITSTDVALSLIDIDTIASNNN